MTPVSWIAKAPTLKRRGAFLVAEQSLKFVPGPFPVPLSDPCSIVVSLFPSLPGVFPVRSRSRRNWQRQKELFLTT